MLFFSSVAVFCLGLTLGSGRSGDFIVTFPQARVSLRALLPFFFFFLCSSAEEDLKYILYGFAPPLPGAGVQGMFARKPNPTLMLIQGQRNSCNLSLYLLGSLSPSHILGISSVDCCLSHQCSLFCSVSQTLEIVEKNNKLHNVI